MTLITLPIDIILFFIMFVSFIYLNSLLSTINGIQLNAQFPLWDRVHGIMVIVFIILEWIYFGSSWWIQLPWFPGSPSRGWGMIIIAQVRYINIVPRLSAKPNLVLFSKSLMGIKNTRRNLRKFGVVKFGIMSWSYLYIWSVYFKPSCAADLLFLFLNGRAVDYLPCQAHWSNAAQKRSARSLNPARVSQHKRFLSEIQGL